MKRFVLVLAALLLPIPSAIAEEPPQYFVDETKLPFDPLPDAQVL